MTPHLPLRAPRHAIDARGSHALTLTCLLTAFLLLAACQKQAAAPAAAAPASSAAATPPADAAPRVASDTENPDRSPAAAPPPAASTPARKAEVVNIINSIPIAFDAGAGTVSADSLDGVAKAARALASTPDLRVQINLAAGANEALARQRAEALKVQLIINGVSPGAIDTKVLPAGTSGAANRVSFSSANGAA